MTERFHEIKPRGDISKLPRWAQLHITTLSRRITHLEAEAAHGPADSTAFLDPYDTRRPLGAEAHVEFVLGTDKHGHPQRVSARVDGGSLLLMGDPMIAVYPKSSNLINVALWDR